MHKLIKRLPWLGAGIIILFFALNYQWTHAAFVALVSKTECEASLVKKAKVSVAKFYQTVTARPVILCLNQPQGGLHVPTGQARFAPFLPAIVILGPNGMNNDVMAHELAHAELSKRIGVLKRSYHLPTWFDEGLAMQFAHRTDYALPALHSYHNNSALKPPTLEAIATPSRFFQKGDQGKYHYAFARCVVGRWLRRIGSQEAKAFLMQQSWRQTFPMERFTKDAAHCHLVS